MQAEIGDLGMHVSFGHADDSPVPRHAHYCAVRGSVQSIEGGPMDTTQLLKGVLDVAVLAVLRTAGVIKP